MFQSHTLYVTLYITLYVTVYMSHSICHMSADLLLKKIEDMSREGRVLKQL